MYTCISIFFFRKYSYTLAFEFDRKHYLSVYFYYYVRHQAETHENRRFFSSGMEFAENAYAYMLKAPSRS